MLTRSCALAALLLLPIANAVAAAAPQNAERAVSHYDLGKRGLAIQGYDPVAYRQEGGGDPAKGKKSLEVHFGGALYRFANEVNRNAFVADPERYEPRYGGWCAWAMASGEKVEVDPESFAVEGDRLYLFYDGWFNDTRAKWVKKGGDEVRPAADKNWDKLTGEPAVRMPLVASIEGEGLGGFDPTSYSTGTAPTPGSASTTSVVSGVRYRFESADNRAAFLREPSSFLPRYGGHAALALAAGELVPGDPAVFAKQDGGLVLFRDAAGRDAWAADAKKKSDADRAWTAMLAKRKRVDEAP